MSLSLHVVAGEMLSVAELFLEQDMHPTVIIAAYRKALDDIITLLRDKIRCVCVCVCVCGVCVCDGVCVMVCVCVCSVKVDMDDHQELMKIVGSTIGTKFIKKW